MGSTLSVTGTGHYMTEGQCYLALITWYIGSKMLLKNNCQVLIGLFVIVELMISSMTGLLRIANFFTPGIARTIIVYEVFGVILHMCIVLTWGARKSRDMRYAKPLIIAAHAVPLAILIIFASIFRFDWGVAPGVSMVMVTIPPLVWGTFACIFTRNGFCQTEIMINQN